MAKLINSDPPKFNRLINTVEDTLYKKIRVQIDPEMGKLALVRTSAPLAPRYAARASGAPDHQHWSECIGSCCITGGMCDCIT